MDGCISNLQNATGNFFFSPPGIHDVQTTKSFSCDAFDPEHDVSFAATQILRGNNWKRIPLGHREGWAGELFPPPRRFSTRTEAPVTAGRLNGAEECYEKL